MQQADREHVFYRVEDRILFQNVKSESYVSPFAWLSVNVTSSDIRPTAQTESSLPVIVSMTVRLQLTAEM